MATWGKTRLRAFRPAPEYSLNNEKAGVFGYTINVMRVAYFCMGCLLVALGVIGAVTPLLPTTIFLIGAAGCFARSSPRLEAWLLDHPRFGKPLRDWRAAGAISRPSKIMACSGMTIGFVVFWFSAHPSMLLAAGVAGLLLACAGYVVSRPTIANQP